MERKDMPGLSGATNGDEPKQGDAADMAQHQSDGQRAIQQGLAESMIASVSEAIADVVRDELRSSMRRNRGRQAFRAIGRRR